MNFLNTADKKLPLTAIDNEILKDCKTFINDTTYFNYLEKQNGGYYYNRSLNLYSLSDAFDYRNIRSINKTLLDEYQEIIEGIFCFGQDVFGNQFAFYNDGILFFNIETGEREHLAKNFAEWINILEDDLEYLTGITYLQEWEKGLNKKLPFNSRLCPKIPFLIGGDYASDNFYEQVYPKYFESNANIARQIFNLPDGTSIKLDIE